MSSNSRFVTIRLVRYLSACCLVIGLFGPPIQMAHSASIATDGDIMGDGVSLQELKDITCAASAAAGVSPTPLLCLLGPGERFAFTTSTISTVGGNFLSWANTLTGNTFTDGLLAGDAVCQHHADNATPPLPGTYKAWLSTSTVNAKDRIGDNKWLLVDGTTVVADGLTDLLDGANPSFLQNPINQDENGNIPGSTFVHTGTVVAGIASIGQVCLDYIQSGLSNTRLGEPDRSDSGWTSSTATACTFDAHLFCFGW